MKINITTQRSDVTGDGIPDKISLNGDKTNESPYITNIILSVQNGRTGRIMTAKPTISEGYDPTLYLGDFTADGVNDILMQMSSGGSGGGTYNYIFSFAGNRVNLLFDSEAYNNEFKYQIRYLNYYGVKAISELNNSKYLIDISFRDPEYLNDIYDKNGLLKKPIEGFVNPLSSLFPIDIERDGVYELMAFQKVAGRYDADSLGYFQNILKWDGEKFKLFQQYLAIFGAENMV